MTPQKIIKRPIALTEKATILKDAHNQVVFEVDIAANKIQIKDAVEKLFDVKVKAVNTLVQRGKVKTIGRRDYKKANWKKAIVTLAAGQNIEFFAASAEEGDK